MNERENLLRTVHFERPDYVPMSFGISPSCWHAYPLDALHELVAAHPFLFPNYDGTLASAIAPFDATQHAAQPLVDDWGCVWKTIEDGITGTVVVHPLADWDCFDSFCPPDPARSDGLVPQDWDQVRQDLRAARDNGRVAIANLRHGHTFLRLQDLRGYQSLILDMVDHEPRMAELIARVERFNLALVYNYLEAGAEWLGYPEDLGMQFGPMLSPSLLREYIYPSYKRIMKPAREAGCIVHMHCDGDVRLLVDDLLACGVQILNIQDLVNGIDWIAEQLAGRVCIDLDIDRQAVTRFGSPAEVDALVRDEVEKLGSPAGGLMMIYGMFPGIPLENVRALMGAMTRYATYYS